MELYIAAAYNAGFGLFHLGFWKFFEWKRDLGKVSEVNRGVMQVLNICLTLVFTGAAVLYATGGQALYSSSIGQGLLIFFAVFWALRLVLQPVFFGNDRISLVFSGIFAAGAALHAWIAVQPSL